MKRLEHRPRQNCSDCGIRFVFGAMLEDWDERLNDIGLTKVYGLYPDRDNPDLTLRIDECDGVFMSDIVHADLKCPNCGAGALEAIEAEYVDHCLYCRCTRDVREPRYFLGAGAGQPINWVCADCPEEPDPVYALHEAVRLGDVKEVERLLDTGVEVDAVMVEHEDGETPLMWAAGSSGHLSVAHLLLERGANVNAQNSGGWTALFNAACSNKPEMVTLLLECGADGRLKDEDGDTALDLALKQGHNEIAALLQTKKMK
ncbi:MAG: ankyrin repeat domain-containing protein [Janthinobacterium lividum]